MKPAVAIFIAPGTEETEAIAVLDILRRGQVDASFVSIEQRQVSGAHGITLTADTTIQELAPSQLFDAIVLPGGLPGANHLDECTQLEEIIQRHHEAGKYLCAICAAPMVLGKRGLLQGKKASAYPGFQQHLTGAQYSNEGVSEDGQFITGRGPAYAFHFALSVLQAVTNKATAEEVAAGLLMNGR